MPGTRQFDFTIWGGGYATLVTLYAALHPFVTDGCIHDPPRAMPSHLSFRLLYSLSLPRSRQTYNPGWNSSRIFTALKVLICRIETSLSVRHLAAGLLGD